ncbi:MAG: YggU family protein [Betaproteobacteria bacterium]|nr:MAG: YggU family protein [Betaproteobacteria bacterium]
MSADGTITLQVHAQPGAKRTEVVGVHGNALKIRLAAPAVEGRANDALIVFLAASFDVPRRNVTLIRGEAGRRKTVRIVSPVARPDRDWGL